MTILAIVGLLIFIVVLVDLIRKDPNSKKMATLFISITIIGLSVSLFLYLTEEESAIVDYSSDYEDTTDDYNYSSENYGYDDTDSYDYSTDSSNDYSSNSSFEESNYYEEAYCVPYDGGDYNNDGVIDDWDWEDKTRDDVDEMADDYQNGGITKCN
jgi:hypothetical protein